MLEVELKFPVPDHSALRQAALDLGASVAHDQRIVDDYYNHPSRDFATSDEALRVRTITEDGENEVRFTYKGPKLDKLSKAREEVEFVLGKGHGGAPRFLEALSFRHSGRVVKQRETLSIGSIEICLDTVEDLGTYAELELESEDMDAARTELLELASRLGLDPQSQIRTSYLELLLQQTD